MIEGENAEKPLPKAPEPPKAPDVPTLAEPLKWSVFHLTKDWTILKKAPIGVISLIGLSFFLLYQFEWKGVVPLKDVNIDSDKNTIATDNDTIAKLQGEIATLRQQLKQSEENSKSPIITNTIISDVTPSDGVGYLYLQFKILSLMDGLPPSPRPVGIVWPEFNLYVTVSHGQFFTKTTFPQKKNNHYAFDDGGIISVNEKHIFTLPYFVHEQYCLNISHEETSDDANNFQQYFYQSDLPMVVTNELPLGGAEGLVVIYELSQVK